MSQEYKLDLSAGSDIEFNASDIEPHFNGWPILYISEVNGLRIGQRVRYNRPDIMDAYAGIIKAFYYSTSRGEIVAKYVAGGFDPVSILKPSI